MRELNEKKTNVLSVKCVKVNENQNGKHSTNEEIAITNGFDAFFSPLVFGHVAKD